VRVSPVNLGDVLTSLGRYGEALESYQKALNRSNGSNGVIQNSSSLYIGLGNVYTALGRLEEAREAFDTALRLDAYSLNAMLGLGRIRSYASQAVAVSVSSTLLRGSGASVAIRLRMMAAPASARMKPWRF